MSGPLKPGDRVRVTVRNRMAGHLPGETGTVIREAFVTPAGDHYYAVAMDIDATTETGTVFAEDEIEPDV
jgi:hypothetical protein